MTKMGTFREEVNVNKLEGKKTYIVGAVMILLTIAKGQGWITADIYAEVTGILAGLGLWTLRAGISKVQ